MSKNVKKNVNKCVKTHRKESTNTVKCGLNVTKIRPLGDDHHAALKNDK